jgi:hypothetical protein
MIPGDLDHNMDYSKVIFYITIVSKNHFPIKYDDPLNGFATFDYFRGKHITIPMCVRKFLNVRLNFRFKKKTCLIIIEQHVSKIFV